MHANLQERKKQEGGGNLHYIRKQLKVAQLSENSFFRPLEPRRFPPDFSGLRWYLGGSSLSPLVVLSFLFPISSFLQ
jgi:hypothetical protein